MFESLPEKLNRFAAEVRRFIREKRKILADEITFSNTHQIIHFWVLVAKHFDKNRCLSRAASLTFSSLLALVPLAAVVLSISTSVIQTQDPDRIENYLSNLVENIAPQLKELELDDRTGASESAEQPAADEIAEQNIGEDTEEQTGSNPPEFDLELMSVADPDEIPAQGTNEVYVARDSRGQLYFKIFNGEGRAIANKTEADLSEESERLEALKERLVSLWAQENLSPDQKRGVIGEMISIPGLIPPSTAVDQVVDQIMSFVDNAQPGSARAVGGIALILVALSLMITVESSFNDIWNVKQGRSWWMRLVQYWTVLTLGSILIFSGISLTVAAKFKAVEEYIPLVDVAAPFLMVFLAFTLFYLLVPNTRVQLQAAAVGGVVGALLWQGNKLGTVFFAQRILREKTIYEGFAVVPVFMLGIYLFWVIVLFGAQVAYAFQYRRTYVLEKLAERISFSGREFAGFRVMAFVGRMFHEGRSAPTVTDISRKLEIPEQLTAQLLEAFVNRGLLQETNGDQGLGRFTPARPLERISAHDIIQSLREGSGHELETADDPARKKIKGELDKIRAVETDEARKITLAHLAKIHSSRRRRPRSARDRAPEPRDNS